MYVIEQSRNIFASLKHVNLNFYFKSSFHKTKLGLYYSKNLFF